MGTSEKQRSSHELCTRNDAVWLLALVPSSRGRESTLCEIGDCDPEDIRGLLAPFQ